MPIPRERRWFVGAALALLAVGVLLRSQSIASPDAFLFDEPHFVENARRLGLGLADQNDHPPLGKLLILGGMRAFGDDRFGHRIVPAIFGALLPLLGGALAWRLFRDRSAALLATALIAADGFFVLYSRAAMLDGMLATLIVASALAAHRARRSWAFAIAGTCAGLAMAIKLSGVVALAPIALSVAALDRRRLSMGALASLTAALAFVGTYSLGLAIGGRPCGLGAVLADNARLLRHHAALMDWDHPATSGWTTWFLPLRPIVVFREAGPAGTRLLTTLGNPLGWWAASCWAIACVLGLAWRGARPGLEALRDPSDARGGAALFLGVAYLAVLAPWVLTHRDSYVYHYLPAYAFALVGLAGALAGLARERLRLAAGFVTALVLVAVFYAPVWTARPSSEAEIGARLFLPTWR